MKNLFITITLFFFTLNFYGQSIESPNSEFELNFYLDKKMSVDVDTKEDLAEIMMLMLI